MVKNMTTLELCKAIPEIPRATLYRHINVLLEAGLIKVVEERKVRGSYERTFAFDKEAMKTALAQENLPGLTSDILNNMQKRFQAYFGGGPLDRNGDSWVISIPLMADDEEFKQYRKELCELNKKYMLDYREGRKLREVVFMSAPFLDDPEP